MEQKIIQVPVPESTLVKVFLEKMARSDSALRLEVGEFTPRAVPGDFLPAVGDPWNNEHLDWVYAGLTLHQGAAHALVLLPDDGGQRNWKDAVAWAIGTGGVLPSRMDALVLWQNLPKHFKEEWYWTSEEYARNADFAWFQCFYYGTQNYVLKSHVCRCRAVRRVAL